MQFVYELEIPPNTLEDDAVSLICGLSQGTVSKVMVGFPPGPKGLAHIVICRFEAQVWPTNRDTSFAWDNHVIEFGSDFLLDTWPFTMKLYGWNLDDTYEHTITVGFNVRVGGYNLSRLFNMTMPQGLTDEGY